MKKFMALSALCISLISSSAFACKLTLINDTNYDITIHDANTGKGATVAKGKVYVFEKEERQNFTAQKKSNISRGVYYAKPISVRQHACSTEHAIDMKVSDLMNNKIDTTLFEYVQSK